MNDHIKVALLGFGGHAKVIIECLTQNSIPIQCAFVPHGSNQENHLDSKFNLISEDTMADYLNDNLQLINGVGSTRASTKRENLYNSAKKLGFSFYTLISSASYISRSSTINEGTVVFPGSIIQCNSYIGKNVIINNGSCIEHDVSIGDHCHIATRAVLTGNVNIGKNTHIGAGAVVVQGVQIGSNVTVGAGATIFRDIPDNSTVVGHNRILK